MKQLFPNNPDIALHMPYLAQQAVLCEFIIELGCGDGDGSLRALSAGLRRAAKALSATCRPLMISVDLRSDRPKKEHWPPDVWWNLIHGDTTDPDVLAKAEAIAAGRKADLIFIDTNHTGPHVLAELELWTKIATPATVWLFHDTWMNGRYNFMTDSIKAWARAHSLEYIDHSTECHGLGVVAPLRSTKAVRVL